MKQNPEVKKMRQRVVLAIVRRQPGSSAKDVLVELRALHAAGNWPQMPTENAQNAPYLGQAVSLLDWLSAQGLLVQYREHGWMRLWATPEGHAKLAADLLPPEADRPALLQGAREFMQRMGVEMAFGVTTDMVRVVRVATERGVIDFEVTGEEDGWAAALDDAYDAYAIEAATA